MNTRSPSTSTTSRSSILKRPSLKSTSRPQGSSTSTIPKKSIESTQPSVANFIYMCFMFIFKRFVFAPTYIKIGIYISALIGCSLIRDFGLIKNTNYLANKNNIFNRYFVKLGWAWTMVALVPFITMTSLVYTSFNPKHMKNHLSRILIATLVWYVLTSTFDFLDGFTGNCSVKDFRKKLDCKVNKHEWLNGFDISGHTFILIYSLLMMVEEVGIFNEWDSFHRKLLETLDSSLQSGGGGGSDQSRNDYPFVRAESLYRILTPYIKINFVFMAFLALLWEIMLLSTFLYFHTMMHKLLAAFCAVAVWFCTYKYWYVNKNLGCWTPGLPGDGSI